jgi:hypothetical protein
MCGVQECVGMRGCRTRGLEGRGYGVRGCGDAGVLGGRGVRGVVFRRELWGHGGLGDGGSFRRDLGGGLWFRNNLRVVGSAGLGTGYGWGVNLMGEKMHKWGKINGGSWIRTKALIPL